ncbi:DUF1217 domain-containing protein [Pseudovibrio exalbescens]|uniref:Flagellar biosynthesis protein FlgF n=1 Tax=Pseudovibrio exalbescens TaxID=197461 RepID=A0A1U7JEJ5_9HYPH|nr:DUF1217 domain-containing protein [Pseudovibrio exalbescens]OKL43104.1 flagellar biosynthesis protein FlgF [Pseudovibrio exalbescens]
MLDTALRYTMLTRDMGSTIKRTSEDPIVDRESQYYLENIRNIKTIDQFLEDDRIFTYAMKAKGLGDMAYAKGLMRDVLEQGIQDKDSYANRLNDKRYYEFAKAFNFEAYGGTATNFDRAQQEIVDSYILQTLEEQEGAQNEGVRLALYFQRKAPEINTAYDILADQALYAVVRTAIGMPESMVGTDVDRQADYIDQRLDLESLKDPEQLGEFLTKFTNLYDVQNNVSSAPTLSLFQNTGPGVNPDLLLQVNSLKFGG